ncbi:MAG: winged helix-turn-helix domain-containing protein [Myxococcales bacterium]|nr:winged helix-turn-helix domain-containing protein [Myxococcales bacterium]
MPSGNLDQAKAAPRGPEFTLSETGTRQGEPVAQGKASRSRLSGRRGAACNDYGLGDDFDDDTSEIPVALSRRELSELVSTSFETAIRVMTRWERDGVLETTERGFVIRRMSMLAEVAGVEAPT